MYLTTRLLMMCYWLTCPILILFFYALVYMFPKSDWTIPSKFWRRYLWYFRNTSGFCWIILGVILVVNTFLNVFYVVDIFVLGNGPKYSNYWELAGSTRPQLTFCSIVGLGSVFYWLLAMFSYQTYWKIDKHGTIKQIAREYWERLSCVLQKWI